MTTALPSTVTYGTVTGRLIQAVADTGADVDLQPDAVPVQGSVTFTPSPGGLLATTAVPPTTILPAAITVQLQPDGSFQVMLVATDDPNLNPADWTYTVSFDLVGVRYSPFPIKVPGGQTVDITTAAPVPSSGGAAIVKGDPGPAGPAGINTPPAGTPANWVGVSNGSGGVRWIDPVTLGLAGSSVTTNTSAGTFTVTQGQYAATGYTSGKTDQLLLTKANASDVSTALDQKVSTTDLGGDLALKVDVAAVGQPGGVVPLGSDGKVASQYLPASSSTGSSSGLTYAGVITGTYTGTYTPTPNSLVHVDNRVGSDSILLPANAGRVAVHSLGVTAPNLTTISVPAGKTFDNGATSLQITGDPVIGYEFEQVSDTLVAIRVTAIAPTSVSFASTLAQAAQADVDALSPRVDALERTTISATSAPPRSFPIWARGRLATGEIGAHVAEFDYAITAVRVRAKGGPIGPCTVLVQVDGVTAYTLSLSAGTVRFADTAANIAISTGQLVTLVCIADGGAVGLEVVLAEQALSVIVPTIGTVTLDSLTAQAGAFSGTFHYASKNDNTDDLSAFQVRYLQGSTPPKTITDGTPGPLIAPNGQVGAYTFQITGLPELAGYAVAVFPIAKTPGLVGIAGTGTVTTNAADRTAPGSGTLTLQSGTKNQYGGTVMFTPDPASPDFAGFWLRESGTATPPATVTSGHPANSGPTGTGSGLWVPGNGDLSPVLVTINDAKASQNVALSAFPQDTSGNVQATPATCKFFTLAAPTGNAGLGIYQLVPSDHTPVYSMDLTTLTTATLSNDFALDQGWAHPSQGPSARENWAVVTDPTDSTKKVLRLTGKFITNGWYNSNAKGFDSTYTDGITTGTGRYGARGNVAGHVFTYGAWEIKGHVLAPFIYGWKGITMMLWPWVPKGTPSPWPQWEFDLLELFIAGQRTTNMHFDNGVKNGGQVSVAASLDTTLSLVVTGLVERANSATGDPIRIRVWINGILVFDTGLPSQNIAPTPSTITSVQLGYLRTNPQQLQLGFALAYNAGSYNNDGIRFGSNPGTQNFDIYSINMWTAPAAA